ncbi:hypothetical protein LUZ62_029147 [Rhynchospora pubera]|uniref:Uncharacterized protein n=1 Tax=Rhynchospora pubera TaxID=906938 RepID=A0AAV8HMX5_9POAL|nr:hypothetical protein LUZ62_029147 [Rhynchospora pubera]
MGKQSRLSKEGHNRGAWSPEEDENLKAYIKAHGVGKWSTIAKKAGLKRCGKSCRLRWLNYLRPGIKRGNITIDEEDLIIRLHHLLGNKWSLIAGRLPGRTDNEIKNYWNTVLQKKLQAKNGCTDQKAVSSSTEVPELIRTTPIRLTKMINTPCAEKEANNTNTSESNPSTYSIMYSPELKSSDENCYNDMPEESWWRFLLSMDCQDLIASQMSHLQSDCIGFQFPAADDTVNSSAQSFDAMHERQP